MVTSLTLLKVGPIFFSVESGDLISHFLSDSVTINCNCIRGTLYSESNGCHVLEGLMIVGLKNFNVMADETMTEFRFSSTQRFSFL